MPSDKARNGMAMLQCSSMYEIEKIMGILSRRLWLPMLVHLVRSLSLMKRPRQSRIDSLDSLLQSDTEAHEARAQGLTGNSGNSGNRQNSKISRVLQFHHVLPCLAL